MPKNSIKIKANLFDLSKEETELSKSIYEGKVIKCLVAPYHSYEALEPIMLPFITKTTFLFPERQMNVSQVKSFISMCANVKTNDEIRIVTTDMNIIIDMIDGCVRVLTESGEIVASPIKTFMANIHTIRHELLENENYQLSKNERHKANEFIHNLIDKINKLKGKTITKEQRDEMLANAEIIGEEIIKTKLKEMIYDIEVVSDKTTKDKSKDAEIAALEAEIERLKGLKKRMGE